MTVSLIFRLLADRPLIYCRSVTFCANLLDHYMVNISRRFSDFCLNRFDHLWPILEQNRLFSVLWANFLKDFSVTFFFLTPNGANNIAFHMP